MTVVINQAGVQALLNGQAMFAYMQRTAEEITGFATENVSHPGPTTLGIRTGDLHSSVKFTMHPTGFGPEAIIGSDAEHDGFGYPRYHQEHGRPWLTDALISAGFVQV